MEKRTVAIAGVGTGRHKKAVVGIACRFPLVKPSRSDVVCMAVLFTEDSLSRGDVTIEDLFQKYHQSVYGGG